MLLLLWACFLVRGAFYAAAFPVWEGFDEWAHFAVVQRIAESGELLVWRHAPVSREIQASLSLVPVPWEFHRLPPPSLTHDDYWRLAAPAREARQRDFTTLPRAWASEDAARGPEAYEALQPPLYYWLTAPVLRASRGFDLGARVLLLRWFSVALASLAIPICFFVARDVFSSDAVGLACVAVAAAMPQFLIDVARVGNECLGVVLWSLLVWGLVVTVRDGVTPRRALAVGAILGAGLLTKAYFLTAIPPVAVVLLLSRSKFRHALIASAPVLAISSWWYVRNFLQTGALSGLSESEMLAGKTGLGALLGSAAAIDWRAAIDSILFSHLWYGGWSGLTVRSWMYHFLYGIIALSAVGLVRYRRAPAILTLAAVYATFWAGQLYNVVLLYASKGVATSMGWYMYAVIAAQAPLALAGLHSISPGRLRRYVPLAAVCLFVLFDLYTLHAVAIPYYTGVIAHRPNGHLASFHFSDLARVGFLETFTRLAAFKTAILGPWTLLALWAGHLAATVALLAPGRAAAVTESRPAAPPR